ncbi:MAG: transmembrane(s)protein [candidate division WS6 bacterium 34_10]|uniref:Transmembrane(S)protein n=1 Tax=candidate division WS6 bacterium 34_10 TaxID=1641389 RepID=A0A117LZN1_9BACT|nr:MAG: transmembrane(s)protein [candidate division WS6 bacterium 34_10]
MATSKKQEQNPNHRASRDLGKLGEKAKKSKLTFSDLIIPIGAGVILLLLSFFLFLPMIRTARESQDELKKVRADIEHLEHVKTSLDEIDDTQVVNDLVMVKRVIPKVLQVADFVYYIDNLAGSKDLTAGDLSVSDRLASNGVTSTLSYSGSYDDVLDLVDEIHDYSPYLVILRDIELSGGSSNWTVDFEITGYYMPDQEGRIDFYQPFTKYTNFSDIMDEFSIKVQKLDEIE